MSDGREDENSKSSAVSREQEDRRNTSTTLLNASRPIDSAKS